MQLIYKHHLSVKSFALTFALLAFVQWKVEMPVLILNRFWPGSGWLEILLLSVYAAFIVHKMKDPRQAPLWRNRTWILFSIVFFSQLLLGLFIHEVFLMTGKLHLPIPALIVAGPLYRWEVTFMPILFLSTILLTGPAWCSHLCYFGAFDNRSAGKNRKSSKSIKSKTRLKFSFLLLVIASAVLLRLFNVSALWTTILALAFGIGGIAIIVFLTRRKGKMVHCVTYCPIGTITNYLKFVSPFRFKISSKCTLCQACTTICKYDALNLNNLKEQKPGITCTLCGDCLNSCKHGALYYKFPWLNSEKSRNLYLILTVSVHAVFLGLARI